jgi:hypothetical protein
LVLCGSGYWEGVKAEERQLLILQKAHEKRTDLAGMRGVDLSCLYCVHGPQDSAVGICGHPIHLEPTVGDVVAGAFSAASTTTTTVARSNDGLCGPEAQLFEARPAHSRAWRALRPHLPLPIGFERHWYFHFWLILGSVSLLVTLALIIEGKW